MTTGDPQFEGVYGPYTITSTDRLEVQRYRISLLVAGLAMTAALVHWWPVSYTHLTLPTKA